MIRLLLLALLISCTGCAFGVNLRVHRQEEPKVEQKLEQPCPPAEQPMPSVMVK